MSFKIWCAAGVNLSYAQTKDGAAVIGSSVFYSKFPDKERKDDLETDDNEIDVLDKQLKVSQIQCFISNVFFLGSNEAECWRK